MKKFLLSILSVSLSAHLSAQCDTLEIADTNYTLHQVSSEDGNVATRSFDNNSATHWRTNGSTPFPHELSLDLGQSYAVAGFSARPRVNSNHNGKLGNFEIYVSNDTNNWGNPQTNATFTYANYNDADMKYAYFGAVNGRYVKLKALSNVDNSDANRLQISELRFFENTCGATGQLNQIITFDAITKKTTTDPAITLSATTTSSLPITYNVISGPATVSGNILTLTGSAGTVVVRADQAGDATYYPASSEQSFEVIDLNSFDPVVTTRLTEDYPLEMPALMAYPIYASATIDEPDFLSISKIEVFVEGNLIPTIEKNGFYYALWTPAAYQTYKVDIVAHGSNGNTTTETRNINVVQQVATQEVTTLDDVVIQFGGTNSRNYNGFYTLPQYVGAYDKISASFVVECPNVNGGCDDWDRWAYIDIKAPDGNWIQIIRYITPYGRGCSHSIDLTGYESLLQGAIEFRVFIDTWGTGGWQLTLDLEYEQGTPTYPYSAVDELWDGTFDFGNMANLQPYDTQTYTFYGNAQAAELLVSNTGHGWGANNTGNASEFYHAVHEIWTDGSKDFDHDLWYDCNPNPDDCSPQSGTWQYDRAGWCPGAISPPEVYNFTSYISKKQIEIQYRNDPNYRDLCHPNNPLCVSGVTCGDCNAGYNPHNQVDIHMVSHSNTPLVYDALENSVPELDLTYDLEVYPNPTTGQFRMAAEALNGPATLMIYKIDGSLQRTYYFENNNELNARVFDLSGLSGGVYFLELTSREGKGVQKLILK